MYAVITSGSKQYRVVEGQTIKLTKIAAEVGESVNFDLLLLAKGDDITVGKPLIEVRQAVATIISHGRGKKIHIIKFKRRKHHMKCMGHRQDYTEVKITALS